MTPLPDGVKGEELASSKGAPPPHLTLSPRSMSSDEVDMAEQHNEQPDQSQDFPAEGQTGKDADEASSSPMTKTAPASMNTSQPQTRGRSTTMHQTPGSPNARSHSITVADGNDTEGMINRHPAASNSFSVGVASDKNKKCRRTMEDSHAFVYDYGNIPGQGYFAVFDGHAGKHAAEWCGEHFHEYLLSELERQPDVPVPDTFNATFHKVDAELSALAANNNTHSGCTAVTAFLRVEDISGKPVAAPQLAPLSSICSTDTASQPDTNNNALESSSSSSSANNGSSSSHNPSTSATSTREKRRSSGSSREKIMSFITRGTTRSRRSSSSAAGAAGGKKSALAEKEEALSKNGLRRVLYTANVGDARAVICRGGRGVRLTYDHKGSDQQEAKRITDAGGFVMNHRVNGVLAVTRSLGDSSMKEFVVGSPYTTETVIGAQDEWLIVACDGLWDVCEDQEAADLLCKADIRDAQEGAEKLLDFALSRFSSDNISVVVVKL